MLLLVEEAAAADDFDHFHHEAPGGVRLMEVDFLTGKVLDAHDSRR